MSKRTKRGLFLTILVSTVVVGWVLLAKSSFTVARPQGDEPVAAPDAGIADVGPFKVGFQRGLERASFTGRPLVKVFVPAWDAAAFEPMAQFLADPSLAAAMQGFTGVIVPVPAEEKLTDEELEARANAREERVQAAIDAGETLPPEDSTPRFPAESLPVVVIQSLRGPFLSVLEGEAFTREGLLGALETAAAECPPEKSSLFAAAEEDLAVFQKLAEKADLETLRIARDSLAEVAPGTPAHAAAENALASASK